MSHVRSLYVVEKLATVNLKNNRIRHHYHHRHHHRWERRRHFLARVAATAWLRWPQSHSVPVLLLPLPQNSHMRWRQRRAMQSVPRSGCTMTAAATTTTTTTVV